jgi:hypothetical protein
VQAAANFRAANVETSDWEHQNCLSSWAAACDCLSSTFLWFQFSKAQSRGGKRSPRKCFTRRSYSLWSLHYMICLITDCAILLFCTAAVSKISKFLLQILCIGVNNLRFVLNRIVESE